MQLITKPSKRLFSFGCSFTKFFWSTWPEIIAYDLDIPLYNYGQSGAGNQYIANMVCQADNLYNFTEDDLIIVSWTNVAREDRWVDSQWITPGNIYSQGIYDQSFVEKWADPLGYLIRDLASIKLVKNFLDHKKCQFHFFSMCDIAYQFNQNSTIDIVPDHLKYKYSEILSQYENIINFILPSFFRILWNNDLVKNKFDIEESQGYILFKDGHPYPEEHFKFLKIVFPEHKFQHETLMKIDDVQHKFRDFINHKSQELKKYWAIYELSKSENDLLINLTTIKPSKIIKKI